MLKSTVGLIADGSEAEGGGWQTLVSASATLTAWIVSNHSALAAATAAQAG